MRLNILLFIMLVSFFVSCNSSPKGVQNLNSFVQEIQKEFIPDTRVQLFEVQAEQEGNIIYLRGVSMNNAATTHLLDTLAQAYTSCEVKNEIRQLPDTLLGSYTWALVKQSAVPMRAKVGDYNEMVSQATMGTPIRLLDKQDNWYRVQSPDGYIAYMENTVLQLLTEPEMQAWKKSDNRYIYTAVNGWAYADPKENAQVVSDLVEGCIFQGEDYNSQFIQAILPDGRCAYVQKEACQTFETWGNQSIDSISATSLIAHAKRILGVPYLWGGISTKGLDCSGFTKLVFQSQGILLERDASQQQKYGEAIDASQLANLQPGDLLFFGKTQRATHVGIYIGDTRFIHASGMVKINSLDPTQNDYNEKRHKTLICARRILQQKVELPVLTIKQCGWYVD